MRKKRTYSEAQKAHRRAYNRQWRRDNVEWARKRERLWSQRRSKAQKKRRAARAKIWQRANREHLRAYNRAWFRRTRQNPDYVKRRRKYHAQWRAKNPERVRASYQRNAKNRRAANKRWRVKNHKRIIEKNRKYLAARKKRDPTFSLLCRLRQRLRAALRYSGVKKTTTTLQLLGCDAQTFQQYIAKRWQKGMSWKNMRHWHLDHIKPIAAFDKTDPNWQYECFHYTNIQPLWAKDNMKKGDQWHV